MGVRTNANAERPLEVQTQHRQERATTCNQKHGETEDDMATATTAATAATGTRRKP